MEVHFCDICNESVPQRDLTQGRAFLRKGRVVCAACDSAMGQVAELEARVSGVDPPTMTDGSPTADPPTVTDADGVPAPGLPSPNPGPSTAAATATGAGHPHPTSAGSGLAMVLAAMGILLTASVAVLVFERLDDSANRSSVELGRFRGEMRGAMNGLRDEMLTDAQARGDEARRLDRELGALSARQEERAQTRGDAVDRLAAEIAELRAQLAGGSDLAAEVERRGGEVDGLAETVAQMRADIGLIAEKVLELEERPAVAAFVPVEEVAQPQKEEPAWTGLLPDLKSPSSGARWAAVTALGDSRDAQVVPHLVPMLQDSDLFVRMASARVLGDLGSLEAVPGLIDALEDGEASVREQAVVSLRTLTGERFKFDPTAKEGDRAKRVKAWRDWWRRKGASKLGKA